MCKEVKFGNIWEKVVGFFFFMVFKEKKIVMSCLEDRKKIKYSLI